MRTRIAVAAACLSAFTLSAVALADDPAAQQQASPQSTTTDPTAHITRVGKTATNPRRHIKLVRKFTPPAQPSPAYLHYTIIPLEAARWGADVGHLTSRISCESGGTFSWASKNKHSDAAGVAQFMPSTWARALISFPTSVRIVSERSRLLHRRVLLRYSDGSVRRVRGRLVRQRVTIVRRGNLPRWPSVYHGWANVRAAARAMAGLGHVGGGEWSCA